MSAVTAPKTLMTLDEFMALPDDGVDRWLIRGVLWEDKDTDMTKRNRFHSITEGRVTGVLWAWLRSQPEPRGEVVAGDAGFILKREPESVVGTDVAVVSAAMAGADPENTTLFDGPPALAVEILSPNDTQRRIQAKLREYLAAGTVVWLIDTEMQTLTVHRPGAPPEIYGVTQTILGGPELPGFSARVADFFR